MIDFLRTVERLREMMATAPPSVAPCVREATWRVETDLAVQAVLYLYDHMRNRDQFVTAARLIAWALPVSVQSDARVRDLVQKAHEDARRNETPEVESSVVRAGCHMVPDEATKNLSITPARVGYWISVVRLTRSRSAIEYGSGCGMNVFHCCQLEESVNWTGIDASSEQITACREQASRMRLSAAFAADGTCDAMAWQHRADAVGVLHVLEHTAYPEKVLEAAESYCKPGGVVSVVVPQGPWSLMIPEGKPLSSHINVMSLESLFDLVEKRGRVLDARSFPEGPAEPGAINAAVTYEPGGQ